MDSWIAVALTAVAALLSVAVGLPIFKIFQLSGYKARGVRAWLKATRYNALIRYFGLAAFSFIAMIVYVGCFAVFEYARYCAIALYIALAAVFVGAAVKNGDAKLKPTKRMVRLITTYAVLQLAIGAGVAAASRYSPYCQTLACVFALFAPFTALLAGFINAPTEKLIARRYIRRAKRKLAAVAPVVIGITGSYGKTTAKNLLRGMLDGKSVIATPGSYNTPMGICLTVNNDLNNEEYLIAELGARYSGDIKELCGIVSPKVGIITAIGDMHLETLKNRAGVADAKYALAKALPEDGLLVLNGYNAECAPLPDRDAPCKKTVVGGDGDISYKDLKIDARGTSFTLVIDGDEHSVNTKLLGAHIAELTCVCAAAARYCGADAEHIVAAVEAAKPVEHRLQLLDGGVIDDAYNSNPVGAKNALDVLACFAEKKVIITPGFVELGSIEKQCNTELGKHIAAVCDYAYLVGSRAEDIKAGAIAAGMNENNISCFASRDEAVEGLKEISGERIVLFENDLPDNIK